MMFSGFSELELSAIVKMALVVAGSDGNFANKEKAAISVELTHLGVEPKEFQDLLKRAESQEPKDALGVIAQMNSSQKKYVAAFLAVIIAADGAIMDSETRVWSLITVLCGLPTMSIAEGLSLWKGK